jgi:hypothetical protein
MLIDMDFMSTKTMVQYYQISIIMRIFSMLKSCIIIVFSLEKMSIFNK